MKGLLMEVMDLSTPDNMVGTRTEVWDGQQCKTSTPQALCWLIANRPDPFGPQHKLVIRANQQVESEYRGDLAIRGWAETNLAGMLASTRQAIHSALLRVQT